MKRILLVFGIISCWISALGQGTINTHAVYPDNNGSSAVSFEIESTTPINITDIAHVFNAGTSSSDVWIRIGGIGVSSSPLTVDNTNGWVLDQTATVSGGGGASSAPVSLQNLVPISIPANTPVGIVITGGMRYSGTNTAPPSPTSFVDGPVTLRTGGTWGYGGVVPSLGNNPRGFLGTVTYELGIIGNCPAFTNFSTDSVNTVGVEVDWTPGSGNESFFMEYGPVGFTPGNGTSITGTYPGTQPPVYISGLNPDTGYDIYFGEICNSGSDSVYFGGPQTVTTNPTCFPVNSVGLASISSGSVTLNINSSENSFDYEYGPTGYTQGTGTTGSGGNPLNIGSLAPQTSYDVYVRSNCTSNGNGTSSWFGPYTVTTACSGLTAPYFNDFEADTLDGPPQCWEAYVTGTSAFVEVEDFTGTAAPYGGSQALYLYSGSSSTTPGQDTLVAISPQLTDLTAGDKRIRFFANSDDPVSQLIVGTISSPVPGAAFTPMDTITFDVPDTYEEVVVYFTTSNGYNGTDEFIVLAHNLGATFDYIRVDDFNYELIPPCPEPTGLTLNGTTSTTASISFNAFGSSFDFEVGPTGFAQGTGTTGSGGNPLSISGLSSNTTYDAYVRSNCTSGGNGTSIWVGPITFTTACAAFTAPYNEDFESLTVGFWDGLDNCWTFESDNPGTTSSGGFSWEVRNTPQTTSSNTGPDGDNTLYPNTGGSWIHSDNSGGSVGNETRLISPIIDVTGLTRPALEYHWHMFAGNLTYLQPLHVDIFDGSVWHNSIHFLDTIYNSSSASAWNDTLLDLQPYANNGGLIRVRFRSQITRASGGGGDVSIDDVSVIQGPSCFDPAGTNITNIASTSADVFFGGTGGSYQIEYGPCGFTQGTGTVVSGGNPINLTSLTPQTDYGIYVRKDCGVDGFSNWVGPICFTTACASSSLLSGVYTIDQSQSTSGTNFNSFAEVEQTLNLCGVSGPVTFNIQPGNYVDKLQLFSVPGVSATNTITFNGSGQDTLEWNTLGEQATVLLDDTRYVTLFNMNIVNPAASEAFGILVTNNSDSVVIDSCIVTVTNGSTSGDISPILISNSYINDLGEGADVDYLTVKNSTLNGGYYGLALEGNGTNNFGVGHRVMNNHVLDFYLSGIFGDDIEDLVVSGNLVETSRGTADGIYFTDLNDYQIENNIVNVGDYGIYVSDGNDGSTPVSRSRVVNNMVISSTDYAIYLNDFEATDVFHNTTVGEPGMAINDQVDVDIRNNIFTSLGDHAFYSLDALGTGDVVDYNVYYSAATVPFDIGPNDYNDLAAWQTADAARNVNSAYENPTFLGATDLHLVSSIAANDMGDATVGVTEDIDGDTRSATTPDIGADEFTPPSCLPSTMLSASNPTGSSIDLDWVAGSGTDFNIEYGAPGFTPGTGAGIVVSNVGNPPYTLNSLSPLTQYDFYVQDICGTSGTSPWSAVASFMTGCVNALSGVYTIDASLPTGGTNFASFVEVATELNQCGISGPTTFNVAPGTYNENLALGDILGTSSSSTIVFNGGSAASVTLTYSSTADTGTVYLNGTDYVTIKNMTIENTSTSDGWGVKLQSSADFNTIDSCVINMPVTATADIVGIASSDNISTSTTAGTNANNLTVSNCSIFGGDIGIRLTGGTTSLTADTGNVITNNTFLYQDDHAIDADGIAKFIISNNHIDSLVNSNGDAIYLIDVDDFEISGNFMISPDYGMYINDANDGTGTTVRSRVINNMVISTSDYAIYLNDAEEVDVFHNSTIGEPGIAINDQVNLDIRNNIFTSTADFAFESFDALGTGDVIDYNVYYSQSATAFDIGVNVYSDLAAWQAGDATRNVNSFEGNPVFAGALDLHVSGAIADNQGDNSVGIAVDIDGDSRPSAGSTTVDIGADEFDGIQDDIALLEIIEPTNGSCGDSTTVVGVVLQNQGALSATGFTIDANISGAVTQTLSTTYSAVLNSLAVDTVYLSSINTVAGGIYTIQVINTYAVDQESANDTLEITVELNSILAPVPTASADTVCEGQTTTLYFPANNDGNFYWLTTTGDTIDTIDSLLVGPIGANDTTFQLAGEGTVKYNVGPVDNSIGTAGNFTNPGVQQLFFTALQTVTIDSFAVYPNAAGNVVVNLNDLSGTVLQTTTVAVTTTGKTMIPVGFTVPPGSYELDGGGSTTGGLSRNSTGASYPYSVPGILDITGNSFGTAYYYYFYDWHISTGGCPKPNGTITIQSSAAPVAAFTNVINAATPTDQTVDFDASGSAGGNLTYSWDFGDGSPLVNGVNPSHVYTTNGSFTVTLTVSNGCGSDVLTNTITTSGISLEENLISQSLDIYPNPTNGTLNVSFETQGSEAATLTIMDLTGKVIFQTETGNLNGRYDDQLNISKLARGTYMLRIENGDMTAVRRIIKQ